MKMKQPNIVSFFQKSSGKVKTKPDGEEKENRMGASSDRELVDGYSSSSDEVTTNHKNKKPSKRKSLVIEAMSSDEDEIKIGVGAGQSKKPKYSRASNASGASTPKDYNGFTSSGVSDIGPSEVDFDDEDEEDNSKNFLPTIKGSSKSKNSHGSTGNIDFLKSTKNSKPEKADDNSKQAPWSFIREIKDADGNPIGSPEYDPRTLYISKKDWANMTPFEVQFWEIKKNHFDTILFFQKGKFSELYEGDAMIGHREFDLKITNRVKMSMVGVPESSVDFWIAKFLAKGYKVGKVDQCETALGAEMRNKGTLPSSKSSKAPPKSKTSGNSIVRRELRSVVTSGTIVDGSILTDDASTCLLTIKENVSASGGPSFGVIIMDAATAEFNLSQFEDSTNRVNLETIMSRYRPKEILHERSCLSPATLRVLRNSASSDCTWTALKSDEFLDKDECVSRLEEIFQENGTVVPEVITSLYSNTDIMQALGGLMWYLKQLNLDKDLLTCKNMKILDPFRCSKTMQLDGKTITDLELLQNDCGEESHLLKLLNRCITPFGKRLFRHWLCCPLLESNEIRERLDVVDYLIRSTAFDQIFSELRGLPDLERIISRIHAGACTVPNFLKVLASYRKIGTAMQKICSLEDITGAKALENLLDSMPNVQKLLEVIEGMFNLEENGKELLPIRGKDESYDEALEEESNAEDALQKELKSAQKLLNTSDIMYKHIGIKDIYQIQVPAKVKVPSNWIKMSGTKDCARYYSPRSTQLVKDLKQAREKKNWALKDFHLKVFAAFDKHYKIWHQVVKLVAELDCLLSLAKASTALGEPACRPEVNDAAEAMIRFETLRHPCTTGRDDGEFIANDVLVGGKECRMILLTGPNMAGKSTLLRMTCVAVIMAQIGCYVPAQSAVISPVDRICTRMGASDHIFAHASTFKVEMDDARKILREASSKSLVILDELGRGTSTFDGHAIAFAVLHRLATHSNCLGFFATHYSALTEDFETHPNIAPKYMLTNVDETTREVVFLYKLASGISPKSYGPHVAKMAGISSQIVQRAISISEEFEKDSKERFKNKKRSNGNHFNLVTQADTAFLINLVKNGLNDKTAGPKEKLEALKRIKAVLKSSLNKNRI
ncbi:muts domain V-domain-containing protein [Phakopsora pachyrhizi]|uniref:DNA mismatch repair protein n=1 Tax=Phakopsora pachyrhizi TaxID=170000 RepID=A0AAV0B9W8_PHAPC|nr:muts domain V-domain-containing protein [Phakopsora pachyrhizi]